MMAAATSTISSSRSLLSRISPLTLTDSEIKPPIVSLVKKRSISEEEEARPAKRRAVNEEQPYVDQETVFCPWLCLGEPCDANATREERLHHELTQFVEYISPSKQEREARCILVTRIETLIKARWPDAQVILFGSSATGLELSGGDVDLVVAFDSAYKPSDPEKKRRLSVIGDVLRRSGMTKWVNRIFGAKVPIITFVTNEELGEVSVDISIRNEEDSGPQAIPRVKQFLADLPALRSLILTVKAFLSLRDLNDASQGSLSSYAITLLCISFLQRNPARRAQKLLDDPHSNKSLGLLLIDFFRYYGHDFSYATHYISVSGRGIFTKRSKNWELKGNSTAVLAVQCILNPENNITRSCGRISLIVEAFKEAHHTLQSSPLLTSPGGASLLYCIYEIFKEDDDKRRSLDESVDSGAFARSAASCTAEFRTRAVSGGVSLATRAGRRSDNNHDQNNFRPPMHIGLGTAQMSLVPRTTGNAQINGTQNASRSSQVVQQLPVLRWQDDRNQQRSGSRLPNAQSEFESQQQHFQNMHMNYVAFQVQNPMHVNIVQQQSYPSGQFITNQGHPNNYDIYNNTRYANSNHFTPRQKWNAGRR